jgi:hypothetical protein
VKNVFTYNAMAPQLLRYIDGNNFALSEIAFRVPRWNYYVERCKLVHRSKQQCTHGRGEMCHDIARWPLTDHEGEQSDTGSRLWSQRKWIAAGEGEMAR